MRYKHRNAMNKAGSGRRHVVEVISVLLALAMATSCGGGGDSHDSRTPDDAGKKTFGVDVSYPTPNANLGGAVTATTVTGNIKGFQGADIGYEDVDYIDVNGQAAVQAMDDPGRWSVQVPVSEPVDTLNVSAAFNDGTQVALDQNLGNYPVFGTNGGIALDKARNRALVTAGNALISVDLTTGDRTILSDEFFSPGGIVVESTNDSDRALVLDTGVSAAINQLVGVGLRAGTSLPAISVELTPQTVDMALDAANDRVLVVDYGTGALSAIDLLSGDRTVISSALSSPRGIAYDSDNGRALVVDLGYRGNGALVAVNLHTGAITTLAEGFSWPKGVTLDKDKNRVLVTDRNDRSLTAVDLATGDKDVLSGPGHGSGPQLYEPAGVVLDGAAERAWIVDIHLDTIFSVDLATGDRTVITDAGPGSGPGFAGTVDVALDKTRNRALVTDLERNALMAVDLTNGDRINLSGPLRNSGGVRGVVVDTGNNRALVANKHTNAVIAVDLVDGSQATLSGSGAGAGPQFDDPYGLAMDNANNRVLVTDAGLAALIAVDLQSGDRTIVSQGGTSPTGSGPDFKGPHGVVLDADGKRAFVADPDPGFEAVIKVDLGTGERTILWQGTSGPEGIAFDSSSGRVLVTRSGLTTLSAVDVNTGSRTLVPTGDAGSGPEPLLPHGVVVDEENNRALVADRSMGLMVFELGSGERAIVSK